MPPQAEQNPYRTTNPNQPAQSGQPAAPSGQPFWRRHLALSIIGVAIICLSIAGPLGLVILIIFAVYATRFMIEDENAKNNKNAVAISIFKVFGLVAATLVTIVLLIIGFYFLIFAGLAASGESS